jgi:hypothetical protein
MRKSKFFVIFVKGQNGGGFSLPAQSIGAEGD